MRLAADMGCEILGVRFGGTPWFRVKEISLSYQKKEIILYFRSLRWKFKQ